MSESCGWKGCRRPTVPGQLRCADCALVIERPKPPRVRRREVAPRKMRTQVEAITRAVSNAYGGVSVAEIRGECKIKSLVQIRMVAMYATRHSTTMSFPEIAMEFGGRDHTTVINACKRIAKLVAQQDAQTLFAVGAGITAGKKWIEKVLGESEMGVAAE